MLRAVALVVLTCSGTVYAAETATVTSTTQNSASAVLPGATPPRLAVTFRNQPVFYIADDGGASGKQRALAMSEALEGALESSTRGRRDAPNASIKTQGTFAVLQVRGYLVGELHVRDAHAAGYDDLPAFARSLEDGLGLFVADQRRRAALQGNALHVFTAGVILFVGLLLLRLARYLFRRADEYLDDRSSTLRPIELFSVPIIGVEGVGAAAALGVAIGRVGAYVGIILTTLSLSLSQFEVAREWVTAALSWASKPILTGLEDAVGAVPRLVLAAFLVVVASGALRVTRLLLGQDGLTRTSRGALTPSRARVLEIVVSLAVVLLMAPLAIGAGFGRFHTPMEILVLALASSGALALTPSLASAVVGLLTIWRGTLSEGQMVNVRGVRGRISAVTPWEVEVEGERARTIIPMLSLVATPVVHEDGGSTQLLLTVKRTIGIRELVDAARRLTQELSPKASVRCVRFDLDQLELNVNGLEGSVDAEQILFRLTDRDSGLEIVGARIGD
ncbi:MAG: hypothetical protein HY791_39885 [Deltaproteobacteria bacterium]|nr:hypothetical protein [Deltaproteobacteria bacterium]